MVVFVCVSAFLLMSAFVLIFVFVFVFVSPFVLVFVLVLFLALVCHVDTNIDPHELRCRFHFGPHALELTRSARTRACC